MAPRSNRPTIYIGRWRSRRESSVPGGSGSVSRLAGQHDTGDLALEDHARLHRLYVASAGVVEQRPCGGKLAQLFQVLDRREHQRDLICPVGVQRSVGREPAEVHALLAAAWAAERI